MQIKLRQLLNSFEALQELAGTRMPAATAFRLSGLLRAAQVGIEDMEKARNACVKDPSNVTAEERAELESLLEKPIDVPDVKVSLQELSQCTMSPVHMLLLDWLIVE